MLGTALAANKAEHFEEETGIRSIYCDKLFRAIERGEETIDETKIVVVEEAGMLGTRMIDRLIQLAEDGGGKIVLTGAYDQLQPIDCGAPFRVICEREGVAQLEEITRQESEQDREMVYDLRAGRSAKVLHDLIERELLYIGPHRDATVEQLVSDWSRRAIEEGELSESLILTGTNAAVREINSACQEARAKAGELGLEKLETEDYDFRTGDLVMATGNHHPLMIRNGMVGTVTEVIDETTLRVRFRKGCQVEIDVTEFTHLSLGYAASVHKYQGQTGDYAFFLADENMTDREQAYVAGSRHRKEARFYSDCLSGGETIEELEWLMERSRQKDLAIEHIQEQTLEMM